MNKIPLIQSQIFYGGDYNPEQWPEPVWDQDLALMQKAGVNLVTLAVFSWAHLEPRPGVYTFDWLDKIIAKLYDNGIGLCLGTASASPPPWLAKYHPESLPVDADNITYWPGGRQAYCPNSSAYREAAAALVRRMAERYGLHPALKIWHVNNEYSCHIDECFCDVSAQAFRGWLEERYQTVDRLNDAWATSFWSQRYDDWDEINPPRRAPTFANPTQNLDWQRFSSDSLLGLLEMEKAILQEVSPHIPITTNFLGFWKPTDYWRWSKSEDVISMDIYPDPADSLAGSQAFARQSDLMRSLGEGRPWVLMEQAPSAVNWRPVNLPKPPGLMRLWSLQAVARGAGAVMFFQWRSSKAGAEKFHSGMVPHGGVRASRSWDEVVRLGADLGRLEELIDTRVKAEAAVIFSWESWWALELDSKPSMEIKFPEQLARHYQPLFNANITTDFVHPGADLSRYKLIVIPNLYLVTAPEAENIVQFVENGGVLIMSFFSGIADENEHIWLGGYPAPFRKMLGLLVEEFIPARPGDKFALNFSDGKVSTADLWAETIHQEGTDALAVFAEGWFAGRPAVTRHHFGRGTAYYIGTRLEKNSMQDLFEQAFITAGLQPALKAPQGVEVIQRAGQGKSFTCLLNHLAEAVTIDLKSISGIDLLTGQRMGGQVSLASYEVVILQHEPEDHS